MCNQTEKKNTRSKNIIQIPSISSADIFTGGPFNFVFLGGSDYGRREALVECCSKFAAVGNVVVITSESQTQLLLKKTFGESLYAVDNSNISYSPFLGMTANEIVNSISQIAGEHHITGLETMCRACLNLLDKLNNPYYLSSLLYIADMPQHDLINGIQGLCLSQSEKDKLLLIYNQGPTLRNELYNILSVISSSCRDIWKYDIGLSKPISIRKICDNCSKKIISICLPSADRKAALEYLATELGTIQSQVTVIFDSLTISSDLMLNYIMTQNPHSSIGFSGNSLLNMMNNSPDLFRGVIASSKLIVVKKQSDMRQAELLSMEFGKYNHINESFQYSGSNFFVRRLRKRNYGVAYSNEERYIVSSQDLSSQSALGGYLLYKEDGAVYYAKTINS